MYYCILEVYWEAITWVCAVLKNGLNIPKMDAAVKLLL